MQCRPILLKYFHLVKIRYQLVMNFNPSLLSMPSPYFFSWSIKAHPKHLQMLYRNTKSSRKMLLYQTTYYIIISRIAFGINLDNALSFEKLSFFLKTDHMFLCCREKFQAYWKVVMKVYQGCQEIYTGLILTAEIVLYFIWNVK